MRIVKLSLRIVADAFRHFLADDGWAIASHIALSALIDRVPPKWLAQRRASLPAVT